MLRGRALVTTEEGLLFLFSKAAGCGVCLIKGAEYMTVTIIIVVIVIVVIAVVIMLSMEENMRSFLFLFWSLSLRDCNSSRWSAV